MSNVVPIRQDEWWTELERLMQGQSDEGMTAHEICEGLGKSTDSVRKLLRKAHDSGRLVVGRRQTTNIIGVRSTVPVYRLKEADNG